ICEGPNEFTFAAGGAWLDDDTIVFTTGDSDLYAAPASGGEPTLWLSADPENEVDFHDAARLPGGRGVLFTVHPLNAGWYIGASDGSRRTTIARAKGSSASTPVY